MIKFIIGKILKILPYEYTVTLHNYKNLSREFGHFKSAKKWQAIDKDDNPIPWYTYPSIEFIKQLDLSDKTVFEYGSGNSTLFWASRCRKVVAIEDNKEWYNTIKSRLPQNVEYLLIEDKEEYIKAIHQYADLFDIIIVDGNYRYDCTASSLDRLSPTGFFILDNADWHPKSSKLLRESGLIEIDMAGFNPINGYTTTTSFYLSRQVAFKPAHDRQPVHGIGSMPNSAE
ncbi:SAM-dependent methyltransferase [Larkinella arboricola]|uniref:Methyltransferase family protein n=1 Tax=Larkinella arboricola TaxID=643671 RepID=A0A327X439_LARAB|nr:SAM-dependent methyltransferase [Larkinella arboricola]RAJ97698.1 hypothetical protein LX87_02601 [Larkinella arboricola]